MADTKSNNFIQDIGEKVEGFFNDLEQDNYKDKLERYEKLSKECVDVYSTGDFSECKKTGKALTDLNEKIEPQRYEDMSQEDLYKFKAAQALAAIMTEEDKIAFDKRANGDISSEDEYAKDYYEGFELSLREVYLERDYNDIAENIMLKLLTIDPNSQEGVRILAAFNKSVEFSDIKETLRDKGYSNSELMEKYEAEGNALQITEAERFTNGITAKKYADYYFNEMNKGYKNITKEQKAQPKDTQKKDIQEQDKQSQDTQLQTTDNNSILRTSKNKISKIMESLKNLFKGNKGFESDIINPAENILEESTNENSLNEKDISSGFKEYITDKINSAKENMQNLPFEIETDGKDLSSIMRDGLGIDKDKFNPIPNTGLEEDIETEKLGNLSEGR